MTLDPPLASGRRSFFIRSKSYPSAWFRAVAGGHLSFGRGALGIFLLTQLLDGVYTYVGVRTFGIDAEGNPLMAMLMTYLGSGPALLSAKVASSGMGICLYLCGTHSVVALLAGLYLAAAVAPWTLLLFF